MSFSDIIKKKHILLIPFSWLYKSGVYIYHKLYDLRLLQSYKPSIPTICVGNLSVGGTGKSPMVEYILSLLTGKYCVAVISRGYGRKTKGYVLANADTTANDIGDEPMQFHQKFRDVSIVVGEKRAEAIKQLQQQKNETDIIILDDAFQHRAVTAHLNILLTEYTNPFPNDWYLPAGSLRDLKSNYKRAHIIVITKCDPDLAKPGKDQMLQSIQPFPYQKIFFASIDYGIPYNIFTGARSGLEDLGKIVLLTGIANPQPLMDYLKSRNTIVTYMTFPDHHNFSEPDINAILKTYYSNSIQKNTILTTEKDAMRLRQWPQLAAIPVFAIPITHRILFEEKNQFEESIREVFSKGIGKKVQVQN